MFGYEKSELEGRTLADIHPPEDLPSVVSAFEEMASASCHACEHSLPAKRQDIFSRGCERARVAIDGVLCSAGFFTNVTERVNSENALRQSEELFSKVFSTSRAPSGSAGWRTAFSSTSIPGFTELTGYTREDIGRQKRCCGDLGIWTTKGDRTGSYAPCKKTGYRPDRRAFSPKGRVRHLGRDARRVMILNGVDCLLTITTTSPT